MAAGRPILAPALPDLEEVLTDDETAVLVKPGETQRAANALRDLLLDQPRAGRLAAAALKASSEFTWEARARKISSALPMWLA
jgi:glycosyltransferase involved in cell wall biosynthesis